MFATGTKYALALSMSVAFGCAEPASPSIGYGRSTQTNVAEAVTEALAGMKKGLGNQAPKLVILVTSGNLAAAAPGDKTSPDADVLTRAVDEQLPPGTKVWGLTSATITGMFDAAGPMLKGVGAMGLNYPNMVVGVGSAPVPKNANGWIDDRASGEAAVRAALADAGKSASDKPRVVLVTGPAGKYEHLVIQGIANVVGADVPIVGGNATGIRNGEFLYYQLARTSATQDQILVSVLYGDFKIATNYGYYHDADQDRRGVATVADYASGALDSITDVSVGTPEPAADVYNRWLDGAYSAELACAKDPDCMDFDKSPTDGSIWLGSNIWAHHSIKRPVTSDPHGPFIMSGPLQIFPDGRTWVCCDGIEQGKDLTFMKINAAKAASAAADFSQVARLSYGVATKDVEGALVFYCDSPFIVDTDLPNKVMAPMTASLGPVPILGGAFSGEIGYTPEAGGRFLAFSASVLLFSKK